MSKRATEDIEALREIVAAIERLWEEGCPVASNPEASARIALRRWHSVARRHRKLNRSIRIDDVANGLIQAFERDPRMAGPLKRDYLCIAERVADVMTARGSVDTD